MTKGNFPMSSALCQSNGYRQLCSLWFEYDPCLNRKPPMILLLTARLKCDHKPDPPFKLVWHVYLEEKKGQRSCFIAYHNIYMSEINMYTTRAGSSSVIRPKLSDIPRPTGLLLRFTRIFTLPNINEVIWPVVQVLTDHKGPFPRWG